MTNKFIRDVKEVIRRLRNRGISFDANRQYPAIPTIDNSIESHTNALRALREAVETHERRNPKAALDSFVRLYELEDALGGFEPGESTITNIYNTSGGNYTGISLGDGSDVYKETDNAPDPRIHRFRSVIGESGVNVTQDDNHVIVGLDEGAFPGTRPALAYIGSAEIGCGQSTVMTPATQLTGLAVGDLIVWVTVQNKANISGDTLTYPPGWTPYYYSKYAANREWLYYQGVFYKFATAADLDPATTHTITLTVVPGTVCSYAFVYRNAHKVRPLSGLVVLSTPQWYGAVPGFSTDQAAIAIYFNRANNGIPPGFYAGDPAATDIGRPPETYYEKTLDDGGGYDLNWLIGHRKASVSDDENWVPGESPYSSMSGAGWTYTNLTAVTWGDGSATFSATAVNSRHHADFPVSLVAGRKYMFALNNWYFGWNSVSPNDSIYMGFVSPAAVERGYVFRNVGATSTTVDPLGDLNTTWWIRGYDNHSSGVPSIGGSRKILMFVAQETGTYQIRVGGVSNSGIGAPSLTFTGTGAEGWNVNSILFREGWYHPHAVYTPDGPVYNGSGNGHIHLWGWLNPTWAALPSQIAFAVNPAWAELPLAAITQWGGTAYAELDIDREHAFIDTDGLTLLPFTGHTTSAKRAAATVEVGPVLYGARRSYYFEIGTYSDFQKWSFGYAANSANTVVGRSAWWDSENNLLRWADGSSSVPSTGSACALGDKFGAEIDFTVGGSITHRFYKNGVLAGSNTISGSVGIHDEYELWYAWMSSTRNGILGFPKLTANLSGPFGFQAAGTVAYDYLGVAATPNVEGITSTGTGTSLLGGTASNPTIKSLAVDAGLDINDDGNTVTLIVDPTEFPVGTQPSNTLASATARVLGRKTAGTGAVEELTASEALDFVGDTRGAVLYRGAAGWDQLTPGDEGQALVSGGVGADPYWGAAAGGGGGGGGVAYTGNKHPDNTPIDPTSYDDEFNGTTLNGKWTWRNQGGATAALSQGSLLLTSTSGAGDAIRILEQTTSGSFKFRAKIAGNQTLNFQRTGLCVIHSGTGKIMTIDRVNETTSGKLVVTRWTDVSTFASNASGVFWGYDRLGGNMQPAYLEIEYDGTTLYFRYSGNGVDFLTAHSEAAASFLGTPDRIGLSVNHNGAASPVVSTCDWFRKIEAGYDVSVAATVAGSIVGVTHVDAPPPSPNSMDDEFEATTLASKWTWRNQGSATAAFSQGCLRLTGAATSNAPVTRGLQIIEQPVASGDFKFRSKLSMRSTASYHGGGLCLTEDSTGKVMRFAFQYDAGAKIIVESYTNVNTWGAQPYVSSSTLGANPFGPPKWLYFEIERSGSTLYFRVSETGEDDSWATLYSVAQTTYFTTAPDRIGLVVESINATPAVLHCEWFRKIGTDYAPGKLLTNRSAAIPPVSPDLYPSTADPMDDEFEEASLNPRWTWRNQGTSTASLARGSIVLNLQNSGSTATQAIRGIEQTLPAGNWKFRAKLGTDSPLANYFGAGMYVLNGANGKLITWGRNFNAGLLWVIDKHTNVTTYAGVTPYSVNLSNGYTFGDWNYFEIEYDGANLLFRVSQSGVDGSFRLAHTEAPGTHLGAAPTVIGIHCNPQNNAAPNLVICDWFRRIA